MARPKKDYTTSVNHGKNKTRSDERAAFKGTKDKARTPSRKYKKATEDAKHAFLMQTGYNKQRSNYDIIRPMNDAKRSIMGDNTYGKNDGAGGRPFVDEFDATKKRLGYANVGDGRVGGTKNKRISHQIAGRMTSSEKKKGNSSSGSYGDYAPMAEADASETLWSSKDRYRDSKSGKYPKKGKSRNAVLWNKSRRNKDKGIKSFSEEEFYDFKTGETAEQQQQRHIKNEVKTSKRYIEKWQNRGYHGDKLDQKLSERKKKREERREIRKQKIAKKRANEQQTSKKPPKFPVGKAALIGGGAAAALGTGAYLMHKRNKERNSD